MARLAIEGFTEIKPFQDLLTPSDVPDWYMIPATDPETLTVVGTMVCYTPERRRWVYVGELDDYSKRILIEKGVADMSTKLENNAFLEGVLKLRFGEPN